MPRGYPSSVIGNAFHVALDQFYSIYKTDESAAIKAGMEEAINEAFSNGIEFVAHQYGIDPEIAVHFALKNWSPRVRGQFVIACMRNNMADIKNMAFAMKNRDRY